MGQSLSLFGSTPDHNMISSLESDLVLRGFTVTREPEDTLHVIKGNLDVVIKCCKMVRMMGNCSHYCTVTLPNNEEQTYTSYQKLMKNLLKMEEDIV